ncbi:unnamed protein product, partial [Mesorhabditis belari]|uniref:Protein kinase domain-containing protein n=1 Tax=Mesorhabditis belari TaxID=2138241 RepID=A0AAF3F4K0_9BILA
MCYLLVSCDKLFDQKVCTANPYPQVNNNYSPEIMFFFDEEQDQFPSMTLLFDGFVSAIENDGSSAHKNDGFGGLGKAFMPTGASKLGDFNNPMLRGRASSDDSFGNVRRSNDDSFSGFFLGDDDDRDWTSSSEENEEPSELIPMSIRNTRRNRQRSSTRTGFFDFYKMLDENLGSGAYASVRTCAYIPTGKEYAVKVVDKATASHTRSRIQREVDTFNLCRNHPNIVQLIEWFEDNENFYMVFEKMYGGPLLDHIQRKKCFTEHEASQVTRDIASALKFLHDRGIAHRDVKPENILCTDRDRVSPIKLCDLDLASKIHYNPERMVQVASEPDLASPVGSAEFMAPEVVDAFVGDALKYDKKCDMWSLGVIVYIMLCGYPPFYGQCSSEGCGWDLGEQCDECQQNLFERIQEGFYEFPEEEWESISEDAKDLIQCLLVRDAKNRFTADEVLRHPWVSSGKAPDTELLTAGNLIRKDSTRDVQQITEHFKVMSRIFSGRMSNQREETPSNQTTTELRALPMLKIDENETLSPSHGSPTKPPPNWDFVEGSTPIFNIEAPSDPHQFSRNYYQYDDFDEVSPSKKPGVGLAQQWVGVAQSPFRHTPPGIETCQSAIARQDSCKEVCDPRREQEVDA